MAKNKKDEEHEIILIGEKISKIPSSKVGFIYTFWFFLSSNSSILECGLWRFETGGTKSENFLPKNQHSQRKLLNCENWIKGEVSKIGHHFRK